MEIERLVYMVNQIARNLAPQGAGAAAEHIRLFWDPRMKEAILAHERAGGEGLDALAKQALAQL